MKTACAAREWGTGIKELYSDPRSLFLVPLANAVRFIAVALYSLPVCLGAIVVWLATAMAPIC